MILIVGATGHLGGLIARTLLDLGKPVRILVRDGSSADDLVAAGAEAVPGDLKDPQSLRAACAGVDAVVTTANSMGRGGDDTIESVDRVGNANLVDAATSAGVRRFVFTSSLGAAADHPVPFMRAKGETEERLRASGMAWTVLQPNMYMETWVATVVGGPALAGRPVTLVGEGRRLHSMVSLRDVGAYAVAALENEETVGKTLPIGGPAPVSWRDVIAAFERALGREIRVQTVPIGEPVPGLPEIFSQPLTAMETYDSALDMSEPAATYGVTPTTLDDFARGFVATTSRERVDSKH